MSNATAQKKPQIFFPNLDGLRFFSFFVVFLFHSHKTIFSNLKGTQWYDISNGLFQNGNLGVNFFFVLSGFLITYLLIKEKEFAGDINVGKFYVRRILRIWPLFYACIFLGFVVFPQIKIALGGQPDEVANIWYYVLLANNFDFMHSWPVVPDALILSVLWSVAVEEQFYLSWPVLVRFIKLRLLPVLMVGIIIGTLIFRSFYTNNDEHDYGVRYFHTFAVIGDMAWGGLLAYGAVFSKRFMQFWEVLPKRVIAGIYVMAFAILFFKKDILPPIPVVLVFERLIIAIVFGAIIMEQNYSKHSLFKMQSLKRISKLGVYTYGLYCLHFVGIIAAGVVFDKLHLDRRSPGISFAEMLLALALSLAISIASYHWFESWFLKWKDKFAVIVKGK